MKNKNPQTLISMEEALKGLKRPIILIALAGVLCNLALIITTWAIFQKEEVLPKLTAMQICTKAIQSVMDKNLDQKLLSEKLISKVKGKDLKADKIHLVKELDSFSCDVFTKDIRGVRRFKVLLDKSIHYAYGLKAVSIDEKKVNSRYQL